MDQNPTRRPTLADMMGSTSSDAAPVVAPPLKRRLTLAEMLKESPLVGSTVSLVDAVESAQATAERKLAGTERADPAAGTNRYSLYARVEGRWVWQYDINAPTHAEGLRQAVLSLKPEHEALPIRFEQDETAIAV